MKGVSRVPNFFILGATKCGTTALYKYLLQHPNVYFPVNKEPQFFSNDRLYSRGMEFYVKRFYGSSACEQALGDATPHYIYYEKTAKRIHQDLPESSHRFIVILRDPVQRAYSLYWNMVHEGHEDLSFEDALDQEALRMVRQPIDGSGTIRFQYFDSGLYSRQLNSYFQYFDRSKFLIVFLEDLGLDPTSTMNSILDFLNLERLELNLERHHNVSSVPRSRFLQSLVRRPSQLRKALGKLLPYRIKYGLVTNILRLNKKPSKYPPINTYTANALRDAFLEDIKELEKITGRDLAHWKNETHKYC
jgi:hypothetical protein